MVGDSDVQPTIAVKDLAAASGFYSDVLGLRVVSENPYEIVFESGNGQLSIYQSGFAGSNKATYATWEVTDIESKVDALKERDVAFEHYEDMEGVTLEGDVHVLGESGEKAVWFKDPDGNILCLHTAA